MKYSILLLLLIISFPILSAQGMYTFLEKKKGIKSITTQMVVSRKGEVIEETKLQQHYDKIGRLIEDKEPGFWKKISYPNDSTIRITFLTTEGLPIGHVDILKSVKGKLIIFKEKYFPSAEKYNNFYKENIWLNPNDIYYPDLVEGEGVKDSFEIPVPPVLNFDESYGNVSIIIPNEMDTTGADVDNYTYYSVDGKKFNLYQYSIYEWTKNKEKLVKMLFVYYDPNLQYLNGTVYFDEQGVFSHIVSDHYSMEPPEVSYEFDHKNNWISRIGTREGQIEKMTLDIEYW